MWDSDPILRPTIATRPPTGSASRCGVFSLTTCVLALTYGCAPPRAIATSCRCLPPALSQEGGIELVATYRGQGGQFASTVAPGPIPGSERFYASYLYLNDTLEVTSVTPAGGEATVYSNPARGEYGARSMVTGPDGNVYLGTLPHAHLLKLDTKAGTLADLGRPSDGEEFVWDLVLGPDGRVYGGTSPGAHLVRYEPTTGKLEDLGRLSQVEQYAHYLAATDDGFVYAGIGTSHMDVVAFEIATRTQRSVLPADVRGQQGQASVYRATDGRAYALAGKQAFRLEGWTAVPVPAGAVGTREYANRTRDGRVLSLRDHSLRVEDRVTGSVTQVPYAYAGRELPIFRLGTGPDGAVYASSVLPARLLRIDPAEHELAELGDLGDGEVYSFLAFQRRLLIAAYGARAPLMSFDPGKPFQLDGPSLNPTLLVYPESDAGWRPVAMITGPYEKVYAGAIAGYGKLGGPLVTWDVPAGTVEQRENLLPGLSVSALAEWGSQLVGGTSIQGGGGSVPTQREARLFDWDPARGRVAFEMVPVSGAKSIDNLVIASPEVACGVADTTLFEVDLQTRNVRFSRPLPFPGGTVWASLARGPDGLLYGLAGHPNAGIFSVNPATGEVALVAAAPRPITAGFAMAGGDLYFASGAQVYRYRLPAPRPYGCACHG